MEGGDVDGVGPGRGVGRRGRLPRTGAAEAAVEGTAGSCKAGKLLTIAMLCYCNRCHCKRGGLYPILRHDHKMEVVLRLNLRKVTNTFNE